MYEDTPQELVHDLISEAVFGSHPLGRPVIGTAEVISSVSRALDPGLPPLDVRAGEHRRLGRRQPRARPARRARAAVDRPPRRARRDEGRGCGRRSCARPSPGRRFQRKDTEQYHVCLGAPGVSRSDRRRFAASILDAILGGSASSRLFQEIREKRGMAYAVYSFLSEYADTGQIGDLRRHARGQPRRGARDRGRADRRHRGRRPARERARARQGEPEGPRAALDGVDLDAHEPARQVADHRLGDPLAGADRGRGRRGRAPRRSRSSPGCCSRPSGCRPRASGRARSGSSRRSKASRRRSRAPRESPAQRLFAAVARHGQGRRGARPVPRADRPHARRHRGRRRRDGRLHDARRRGPEHPARGRGRRAVRRRHDRLGHGRGGRARRARPAWRSSSRRTSRSARC